MNEILKQKSNTWGGARPNAGRPLGSENEQTRKKRIVEEEIKQRVLRSANKLINAQMSLAQGVQMLYVIEKTERGANKKPRLITDQTIIEKFLAGELDNEPDEYYFITTERPDNRALDSLFDRIFGKAVSNLDITSGGEELPQPILAYVCGNNSNQENTEPKKED